MKPSKSMFLAFCMIGGILVIPVLIFVISRSLKSNTNHVSQTGKRNSMPQFFPTPTSGGVSFRTPPPLLSPLSVPVSWNVQQDSRYALAYPSDWHPEPQPAEGRDIYMTFLPKNIASDDAFPLFIVQVYPANATTVEQRISELSSLNFTQKAVTFQGNPAIQLSGILPLIFYSGNPQNKPVLKTYILFQKNNRLYIIDYAYYQDENAPGTQLLFDRMLGTLALPQ